MTGGGTVGGVKEAALEDLAVAKSWFKNNKPAE